MRSQLRIRVVLPVAVLALLGLGVGAFALSGTPPDTGAPTAAPPPHHTKPPAKKKRHSKQHRAVRVVTRAEWAKRANVVCDTLTRRVADLAAYRSASEAATAMEQALALADGSVTRLARLKAPASDAKRIDRMVALFRQFLSGERRAVAALRAGDLSGYIDANARAFAANDRGSKIAKRLGAAACAEGSSAKSLVRRELRRHSVVVVSVYTPDADVDALSVAEARAAATDVGAAFLAVDVYSTRQIAALAIDYDFRDAPATLVFRRGGKLAAVFDGYADRGLVAQAAKDAAL